jgi:hypothetical protein
MQAEAGALWLGTLNDPQQFLDGGVALLERDEPVQRIVPLPAGVRESQTALGGVRCSLEIPAGVSNGRLGRENTGLELRIRE